LEVIESELDDTLLENVNMPPSQITEVTLSNSPTSNIISGTVSNELPIQPLSYSTEKLHEQTSKNNTNLQREKENKQKSPRSGDSGDVSNNDDKSDDDVVVVVGGGGREKVEDGDDDDEAPDSCLDSIQNKITRR
jgi:hypothetical protein